MSFITLRYLFCFNCACGILFSCAAVSRLLQHTLSHYLTHYVLWPTPDQEIASVVDLSKLAGIEVTQFAFYNRHL